MSSETELSAAVRGVLDGFVADLGDRLSTHDLESVLDGGTDDLTSADLGNKPESYTESKLVFALLDAVGLDVDPQPYGEAGGHGAWPDFEVTNLDAAVIGESKPPNNVDAARDEIKDYLDRKSIGADYGVATDGIEWYVYKIELGGDFTAYPEVAHVDLRGALLARAREQGLVGSPGLGDVDVEAALAEFVALFERDAFEELLTRTAPRRLRDERKRDVEAFYDLYIELLFGEGEGFSYETCLLDDVRSPPDPGGEKEKQLFAITLVNRLLFVKFLESRGVLAEGFLRERVRHYEEHADDLGGNLYDTQIKPLFYDLLNTQADERKPKHRRTGSWFADVPYLNGGLFRESIAEEHQYGVNDRILEVVIDDLIEGSRLELNGRGFDPAILGSVFEKTINHIEQERTQKDVGAYYTPNDVTEIVVEQAVDPKIKEVLVDEFSDHAAADDEERAGIRAGMERLALPELLRRVEDGEGWFGSPEAIRAAHERLGELTVLDPACGSGHFLTTAMDEIHRAELSLLRGRNFGEDPDPQERYEAKVNLALNCIYGVDVDDVAAEIAKLRVWLKIVEGNGWRPSYGQLPNVDVNITDGNSLVGLPMTGSFDDTDVWTDDVREIERRRLEYKRGDEGDPRDLERFMADEIRPALDERYLSLFSRPVETEIETREEFEAIAACIDDQNLHPTFESIQVKRTDGAAITDEQSERLEELGFTVYTKSARMDVAEVESERKYKIVGPHFERFVEDLGALFDDGFYFAAAERQPTEYDLDRVHGTPFHWVAEFPEVAEVKDGRHTIEFDVILANPPYGDLLSDVEKAFTSTYRTGSINDISANFVERQVQLLAEGGSFGDVTTLRLVYQSDIQSVHDLVRENLEDTRIACFASRPESVFGNAEVRAALVTGRKSEGGLGAIRTSDFLRFNGDNRDEVISNEIEYGPVDGLQLGEAIGEPTDSYRILPKVGNDVRRGILEKLADSSETVLGDEMCESETDHVVWRKRHPRYWINPYLENLYPEGEKPQDFEPMYFDSALKAKSVFALMQSSTFYLYWMAYGNERDLNWGQIEAFPFPDMTAVREHEQRLSELVDEMWTGMRRQFETGALDAVQFKPLADEFDELFGEIYGLTDEEIEYVQSYHAEYGRGNTASSSLTDFS